MLVYCTDIFFFSYCVEVSNFWGNFFSFLEGGGGLREGGRLLSTLDCFSRSMQGRGGGGGYKILIVMWKAEMLTIWGGGRGYLF